MACRLAYSWLHCSKTDDTVGPLVVASGKLEGVPLEHMFATAHALLELSLSEEVPDISH